MASVSIRGIHVEITQAMRKHAQSALEKIFERNHPIAHEVVVRALPKAEISVSLSFQCAEGRFKVSRTVESTAFYSGLTEAVKVLSSNIEKSRGQMEGRRNGAVDLQLDPSDTKLDINDDVYEDVA